MPHPPATYRFPPVHTADENGLVALSHALDRELLLSAYQQGIFPWTDKPVGWFAPPRRGLLWPQEAHFPRNFAKLLRRAQFAVSFDAAFADVVHACRAAHADEGEWLTPRFVAAYIDLFTAGHAHSVEIWQNARLVGGLYGVQVGGMFCAESMFSSTSNASKAALFALVSAAPELGVEAVDVQVLNETTERLGARWVPRAQYMQQLQACRASFHQRAGRAWPKQRREVIFDRPPKAP